MESLIRSAIANAEKAPETMGGDIYSSDAIRIKVIGVGGAGCNTINRLMGMGIKSAATIAVNTDALHLKMTNASKRVLIGSKITRGLGAGGFPEVAQKCADASRDELREMLAGTELLFLCSGMGGGTGTGASPVIAEVAKEQGAVVVSMVTLPFALERARLQKAHWGLQHLRENSDSLIIIDNNRLMSYVPNLPINKAFTLVDELTARAVKGIADTIMLPSLVNIDFADVRAILGNAGLSVISVGEGSGNNKVEKVIQNTLQHPLLDVDYSGAKGSLLHIAGGEQLTLGEATRIGDEVTSAFDINANVIWGARLTPEIGDSISVTAITTGVQMPSIFGDAVPEPKREVTKELVAEASELDLFV
ncbi:MAG: cell division protein FtsZ [Candidatus Micrarchaeota archaeon]